MLRTTLASPFVFSQHMFASEDFEFSTTQYASLDDTVYGPGTVPPARGCVCMPAGDCYIALTGSNPSTGSGFYSASGDPFILEGYDNLSAFRGVSVAGTIDMHVEYFT